MASRESLWRIYELARSEADRSVASRFLVALGLVVASGSLTALAPLALKALVDAVAGDAASVRSLTTASVAFGAVYVAALCGGRLLAEIRPLVYERGLQRLYGRLSRRFFRHLLGLHLEFHLRRRTGALAQTLSQALLGYQLLIHHTINSILPVIVEVIAAGVVLVSLGQPALFATFVVTAMAYFLVFTGSMERIAHSSHAMVTANLQVHAVLTDSLLNYETIKYFGAEASTRARYASATSELELQWRRLGTRRAGLGVAVTAIFTLSVTVSLVAAGWAVADGSLSIGGFVLASVYMIQLVRPLEMIGTALRDVSQAIGLVRPLLKVLDEPLHDADASMNSVAIPFRAARLTFENVVFGYNEEQPVFSGLNLDVAAGRTIGVVGHSGVGKSSLVRLIMRLYEPHDGRILLDDVPIHQMATSDLRRVIGLVPQDAVLFNDTIAYNIAIGRTDASRSEIERAAKLAHLHEFVSSLPAGYETVVGERGLKLSGGERQRIAIARAVIKRPRLYVLDEATSALDTQTEAQILENLRDVSAGCTTLLIAHRLTTVQHADEIAVLDNGRVMERGTHAALLNRNGIYAGLWRAQLPRRAA